MLGFVSWKETISDNGTYDTKDTIKKCLPVLRYNNTREDLQDDKVLEEALRYNNPREDLQEDNVLEETDNILDKCPQINLHSETIKTIALMDTFNKLLENQVRYCI